MFKFFFKNFFAITLFWSSGWLDKICLQLGFALSLLKTEYIKMKVYAVCLTFTPNIFLVLDNEMIGKFEQKYPLKVNQDIISI